MAGRKFYSKKYDLTKTKYLLAKYYALCYKEWQASDKAKAALVEQAALETNGDFYRWILHAVTEEGVSYEYMRLVKEMPCGYLKFYEMKRKFYFLLAKKI